MKSRRIVRRLIAAALLSGACIAGAAAEDASVKEMKFDIVAPWKSEINITSSDNTKWDTILPNNLTVWAYMHVDTRLPGYVERVGIFLGHCNDTQCGGFPIIFDDTVMKRDYNHQTNINFSAAKFPVSQGGGIPVLPYGDEMIRACNDHLQPDGPTKAHSFNKTIPASFSVNTRKAVFEGQMYPPEAGSGFNGGDHTVHANFTVVVNCIPVPKEVKEPPPQRHNVKVEEIKLFLTTYGGQAPAGRTPGASSCKPLKVTTRIETDKEGPVKVKLWRQIDNGPITSEIKTLDAKALGGDKFGADWDKWEHFGKTTYAQYMAEILGGTFAPSTPWKDITIHCGGNFADAPRGGDGPINPDPQRPGVVVDPPRLSCAGGTLRGNDCVCPRGSKEVQVGANAYRCLSNTGVVADPPRISCAGGTLKGNDCVCPRGNKEVQVGANAYRCVANEPSGPKISCAGGTLKGNDCVCPRGTKEVQVGASAYRCVQNVTQPTPAKVKPLPVQRTLVVPPRRTTSATTGVRVR